MNEDAWENLEARERRDHELIRDYLNEAPVKLENDNWKLGINKSSEMMGSEWTNWKGSWITPDGLKEFSRSKQIREDGNKLESRNLKRMEQD